MSDVWTEERETELRKLHREGLSYSRIAVLMGGGLTRNAISGKVDRLGLSEGIEKTRAKALEYHVQRRLARKAAAPKPTPRPKAPLSPEIKLVAPEPAPPGVRTDGRLAGAPTPLMIPLEHLSEHTCKWPIGTPGQEGFGFCGNRSAAGKPYCGFHHAEAFKAPAKHARPKDYERSLRRWFA